MLGTAYIRFFSEHPTYYGFIYQHSSTCRVVLTLDEVENNYPPFEIFRKVCLALTTKYQMSKEEGLSRLIQCWSLVQGVTSLIISPNIELDGCWDSYLKELFQ